MKIPKEKFFEFLKKTASTAIANGEIYLYFPLWFKIVKDTDEIEVFDFEKLPEPLKKFIEDARNNKTEFTANVSQYPMKQIESFFNNPKQQ
jgi:hypothetical protein